MAKTNAFIGPAKAIYEIYEVSGDRPRVLCMLSRRDLVASDLQHYHALAYNTQVVRVERCPKCEGRGYTLVKKRGVRFGVETPCKDCRGSHETIEDFS